LSLSVYLQGNNPDSPFAGRLLKACDLIDSLQEQLAAKDKDIARLKAELGRLGEYTAQKLSPDEFIRLVQKTVKQILKGKQ
jgi:hypothetical protein